MRVLTVYAHPNPNSFCHAVLERFTRGLTDAGHASDVVDLYAIRFDPVFRLRDFASYVHDSMPAEILDQMNLKQHVAQWEKVENADGLAIVSPGFWPRRPAATLERSG